MIPDRVHHDPDRAMTPAGSPPPRAAPDENLFATSESAGRFERRAGAAIRHAAQLGLFTAQEARTLLDRVHALGTQTTIIPTAPQK